MPTRTTRKTATAAAKPAPAASPPARISLDDLSPADRRRLLDELDALKAGAASEDEQNAARRQERLAALMEDRDHMRDCPGGRVEAYAARIPAKPDDGIPAQDVTSVRCLECGESRVIKEPFDAVLAGIDEPEDD